MLCEFIKMDKGFRKDMPFKIERCGKITTKVELVFGNYTDSNLVSL